MAKYHCKFSTGEIVEWEGSFTKYHWDILRWNLMTWWAGQDHEDGSVIVSVDGRASFALTRTVHHPLCVIRLHFLQADRPIGNHVIRIFDYTEED